MALPTIISNAGNTAVQVSASAATIYGYKIVNSNGYPIYVKFYNKLAANVGSNEAPALTVTVAAQSEATDETEHAFATALSVRCTTRNVNSDRGEASIPADIELELTESGGGGTSEVQPGTSVIQAALDAASPGDVVKLAGGTFVENAGIVIPDGVHLQGAGLGVTVIESSVTTEGGAGKSIIVGEAGSTFTISDLSVVGTLAIGGQHQACFGCDDVSEAFTAVTLRNVRMRAESDCIHTTANCGDLTAYDCRFESSFDVISWGFSGTPGHLKLFNCELVSSGGNAWNSTGHALYAGQVTMYGGLLSVHDTNQEGYGLVLNAFGDEIYFHGVTFDIGAAGAGGGTSYDLHVADGSATTVFVNGCSRKDGAPLSVFGSVVEANKPISSTVAKLPVSPTIGTQATVTDGTGGLAWGATVTGGSSTKYLVFYNGTAWTVIGK